ncbi:caspase family protein [Streptomyces sp. NPDC059909]|uniref:caspase, EACC1-associated type n=1 Tax=Streptomyces sp. NPDC059909 TaxID=3346998 RepID=UPI003649A059
MGRRLALLIATYDYQDAGLRRLTAPAHDAEALAAVLQDPGIAGFDVTTLINEPHHRVGEAIGGLYRDRRHDDLTLLYFTGHGLKDDDGRLYLATANTRRDSLLFTSLPAEQIDQAMSGCVSRQKVLILDCCYSGAFPAGGLAKGDADVHTLERFRGRGRTVLTASDSTQYSFEGNQPHGEAPQSVFTRHLVAGLRDGSADLDGDGDITIDELYSYVYDRVVDETPRQRPKKQDNVEGRIVIARNVNWSLPAHVRHAIESPLAKDRLAALDGLAHLHRVGNEMVRTRVAGEVERLAEDDSRLVSAAAARLYDDLGQAPEQPAPPPPSEPVPAPAPPPTVPEPAPAPAPPPPSEPRPTPPPTVSEPPSPAPRPARDPGRRTRRRESSRARRGEVSRRARARLRGVFRLELARLPGLLAILAAALMGSGGSFLVAFNGWRPVDVLDVWIMALVALTAGVCTLHRRTRELIGPGVLIGAAVASVWWLTYFPGYVTTASEGQRLAYWLEFAGLAVLVIGALFAVSVLIRAKAVRCDPRLPANLVTWAAALAGAAGVAAAAWALSGPLQEAAQRRWDYNRPEDGYLAWAYMAATVLTASVPVWAALLRPRRFGHALLAGWACGSCALALATYASLREFERPVSDTLVHAGALLLLVTAAAVLARWGSTTGPPRPRRTVLVAWLALAPLLAAAGVVVVDQRVRTPVLKVTPYFAAVSPDGRRLYVNTTQEWSNAPRSLLDAVPAHVVVIDTATKKHIGEPIPVGKGIGEMAVGRDGSYVYAISERTNSVSVISTQEKATVGAPIAVGTHPTGLTVTSDGRRLVVFNSESDDLSLIDTSTNKVTGGRIPFGADVAVAAIAPDGRRLYLVTGKTRAFSTIDTSTGKAIGNPVTLGIDAEEMLISPDGRRLYLVVRQKNSQSSRVHVIDAATGKEAGAPISLDSDVHFGMGISPDGRRIYVSNAYAGTLSIVDTATNATVGTPIPLGGTPAGVAVSRDSRHVYVTLLEGRIAALKADNPYSVSTIDLKAS